MTACLSDHEGSFTQPSADETRPAARRGAHRAAGVQRARAPGLGDSDVARGQKADQATRRRGARFAIQLVFDRADEQLGELRRARRRSGASLIRSVPFCVFGNAITSRMLSVPGEQHRQPIHAERDAAVRRRAEAQRVEQEAELLLRLCVARCRAPRTPASAPRGRAGGSSRRAISKPLSTRS